MRTYLAVALLIALAAPAVAQQKTPAPKRAELSAVLHFQIIEADGFTTSDPQIRDVERTLRSLFKFKGYRLAAETMVRVASYSGFEQVVYADDDSTAFMIKGEVRDIYIGTNRAAAAVPTSVQLWVGRGLKALDTSVVVPVGQTVVVGTAKPLPKRAALILVVRPTAN